MNHINNNLSDTNQDWTKVVTRYNRPDIRKSIWQICNSLIPYLLLLFIMYKSLQYPYWITLLVSVLAAGFLIRIFIIFHDCGHGSFFKSRRANELVGKFLGLLVFTPYNKWHNSHHIHHTTVGNLDKRDIGDVWTLTLEEYQNSSRWMRFVYRAFRNPFIMFTIGPVYLIMVENRLTTRRMAFKEKRNVWITNIMLLAFTGLIGMIIGFKAFFMIQVPILLISHIVGIWLFYIQHQFDDVSWERDNNWDYKKAALQGSSFLNLPIVLQWFTGNIGFHHVHHLSSKIPNYNLARCHYENEMFNMVKQIKFFTTIKALNLNLWDEAAGKMISFSKMPRIA